MNENPETHLGDLIVAEIESSYEPHGSHGPCVNLRELVVRQTEPPQDGVTCKRVASEILDLVVGHITPRQLIEVLKNYTMEFICSNFFFNFFSMNRNTERTCTSLSWVCIP